MSPKEGTIRSRDTHIYELAFCVEGSCARPAAGGAPCERGLPAEGLPRDLPPRARRLAAARREMAQKGGRAVSLWDGRDGKKKT